MWEVKGHSSCSRSLPLQPSLSCFLVTQVRFWSLALLQKRKERGKKEPEEMGQIDLSQSGWVLRESFSFFPLKGKQLFSLVHLKFPSGVVPVLDKCHCVTEC